MSESVTKWLERIGLEQYADAFRQNAIEPEHLPGLDHETLKEIGVQAVGHRMTFLQAAAELAKPASATPPDFARDRSAAASREVTKGAELRHLSVMFVDLAGSTELSERLDLEQYREVLRAYQDAARKAIGSYDGYIARYLGDGLLVYFGYPVAHEDDAERAVRAGLEVVRRVAELVLAEGLVLRVRVGIASGRVVAGDIVGEGAAEERAVLGETPNLAARLQALAAPNSVVIADATRRLVEGRFELTPLKPSRVKGLRDPVQAFVAKAALAASRFEASTVHGLSAFVGRRGEFQVLTERWAQARHGEGQVVLLCGEAGIGKSRLIRELKEHVSAQRHTDLRYQCSPYATKTAFFPLIEQLHAMAGFLQEDSASQKLDKLEAVLAAYLDERSRAAPLLAAVLSLPGDRYPPVAMTPQRQKLETVSALVALMEAMAREQPLLVLLEDVHWIDPSTLEVFDAVVERTQFLPLLVVMTYRPEFEPSWGRFGHVTQVSLNRLDRSAGRALVEQVTGGRALPEAVLGLILDRTDGVPLFIEELTKTVLETGLLRESKGSFVLDSPLPDLAIPTTLQDSLMARLDRLAPVREVAQAAACIGREFTLALLAQTVDRQHIDDDLQQLVDAGLVFRRGTGETESYLFKHALVQAAAYDSLLASRRRQIHARVAAALEASADSEPSVLARHFSAAGLSEQAASQFLAAGRRALSVSALPEACAELELGLQEIEAFAAAPARDRLELELYMALGAARIAQFGWPHPSVGAAYAPAFRLADALGHRQAEGPILWGLCVHHWTRADFLQTHAWLPKLEAAADASGHPELSAVRDMTAGCQYFWEAQYERAWRYTAHIRETYRESLHASIVNYTNHDPLCFSLIWAGGLLQWIIGYPDRALELAQEAHALARRINHPFNSAFTLTAGSECLLMRGDTEQVLRCCDEVQRIVDEENLGDFAQHVLVDNWRGRTHTRKGDFETGYRLTHNATTRWRQAEGRICSALFWGGEALALNGLGRKGEALTLIDAAIAHCRDTGDRYMEPEVLRVKAKLMLTADPCDTQAAEATLRRALEVAREHTARSWELRAATTLADLLKTQDRRTAARDLLAPVYERFTEGFDTADLREAKSLLEALS